MSVTIRPYRGRKNQWEVDICLRLPDGKTHRERRKAPVTAKSGAKRWGQTRERAILDEVARALELGHSAAAGKAIPTLAEFTPRFLEGYARAERQKPSGIAAKESILSNHLLPRFAARRLNEITAEDVQNLKADLRNKAPKTVNNVLSVLNKLLDVAVEWEVIDRMPCTISQVKVPPMEAAFHDFDEYASLVEAAGKGSPQDLIVVLLGGDAGLRCGEMMALEWADVDMPRGQLHVQRSQWKGEVTVPKGGRPRRVPMTPRLSRALAGHRHLRGSRVLCLEDGRSLTQKMVAVVVQRAARRANLDNDNVKTLRHTFCSQLAMRGVPPITIQDWAGHKDLKTTMRYMHLSPLVGPSAIRCLEDAPPAWWSRGVDTETASENGEILEAAGTEEKNRE